MHRHPEFDAIINVLIDVIIYVFYYLLLIHLC